MQKQTAMSLLAATLVTCGAIVLASLMGCGEATSKKAPETIKKAVQVEPVTRTDMAEVLTYVADLKPFVEVKLYSPVPDRILRFPVHEGDEVRQGQLIALVRKEGMDKGLEQIGAQMDALDVQLGNLEGELERSQKLLNAGVITRQVFDQVQTSYLATKAQRRGLDASRGQLLVTANNAVITAPISGVVASKMLHVGDMAAPQIPLARVLQIDKLKAELKLIEEDVDKIKEGMAVNIRLDAFPGKVFSGVITRIMPYIDPATRTNMVEVVVDNPRDEATGNRHLKPGMFGRAELVVEQRAGVLSAPEPALLLDNQVLKQQAKGEKLRKAFVVDAQQVAHQRLVRIGTRKGSQIEILDGLSLGDQVVVRGQHTLKDGQAVEIVAAGK